MFSDRPESDVPDVPHISIQVEEPDGLGVEAEYLTARAGSGTSQGSLTQLDGPRSKPTGDNLTSSRSHLGFSDGCLATSTPIDHKATHKFEQPPGLSHTVSNTSALNAETISRDSTFGSLGSYHLNSGTTYQQISSMSKDSWEQLTSLSKKYDRDMCYAWRDEIDKLLVFAGLFSSVVTAFIIESYQWLQPNYNASETELLTQILQAVSAENHITTTIAPSISTFTPSSSSVRINIAWFLSLVLSVSTVLIGILCTQWIREYQREAPLPHKEAFALRQMRFEGLEAWKVPRIMSTLPLFLQSAVVLFFAGLVDLLWSLHPTVALAVSVLVGLVLFFMLVVVLLPIFQFSLTPDKHLRVPQCPYKSPQSLAVLRFVVGSLWLIPVKLKAVLYDRSSRLARLFSTSYDTTWVDYDVRWCRFRAASRGYGSEFNNLHDTVRGMAWINKSFTQSTEIVKSLLAVTQELDVENAKEFVTQMGVNKSKVAIRTLQQLLDASPDDNYKMDVISATFLRSHLYVHQDLSAVYLDYAVRAMQATYIPGSLSHWTTSAVALDTISDDTLNQLVGVIRITLQRNAVSKDDISTIWEVIAKLGKLTGLPGDLARMKLLATLYRELASWLQLDPLGSDLDVRKKIELCVIGLYGVAHEDFYLYWHNYYTPDYEDSVQAFAILLDTCVTKYGGLCVILGESQAEQLQGIHRDFLQKYMIRITSLVRSGHTNQPDHDLSYVEMPQGHAIINNEK